MCTVRGGERETNVTRIITQSKVGSTGGPFVLCLLGNIKNSLMVVQACFPEGYHSTGHLESENLGIQSIIHFEFNLLKDLFREIFYFTIRFYTLRTSKIH